MSSFSTSLEIQHLSGEVTLEFPQFKKKTACRHFVLSTEKSIFNPEVTFNKTVRLSEGIKEKEFFVF